MRTISVLFLGLACLILPSRTFSQSKSIFDDDWKPPTKTTPTETRPVVPPDTTTPFKPPVQPPIEVQPKPPVIEAPVVPTAKAARPDNRRYDEVLQKVRMIFEKEYARTDVSGRKDLARSLLTEAGKIQKNVDAKYVLLSESRDLSAGLGDTRACREAIQQLEASHDVVAPALAADALLKLLPKVPNDKTVIGWGLETLDQLLVTDDYATAAKLAQAMTGPVSQARDAALTARFRTAQAHLGEYTRVAPSLDKLKSAPDDPAANLAAGRFYCFQKLDWAKGLPLLAKGSDPILKMLATKDLSSPDDAAAQLKLGHQWWDFAKDNAPIQASLYARAGHWYEKALPGLSDELDRSLAKRRLAEIVARREAIPAATNTSSRPSKTFTNSIGIKFVRIEPGEFTMGSPAGEAKRGRNEAQHKATVTKPFYLGIYEVTQEQYAAVIGVNPSKFKGERNLPVEGVSWEDAVVFCRKLSQKENNTYRLPTEAEWEYACRAGTTDAYGGSGKLDDIGWHMGNSGRRTHPVGQKQPNAWGLYDMNGNVWEWCADWIAEYPDGAVSDPIGPANGTLRASRGGSCLALPQHCRNGFRGAHVPAERNSDRGFRIVLELR